MTYRVGIHPEARQRLDELAEELRAEGMGDEEVTGPAIVSALILYGSSAPALVGMIRASVRQQARARSAV